MWNRWWKVTVGKAHPNIFAIMEKTKKKVEYSATQGELVELGNPPAKKIKYVHNDERLHRLAEQFNQTIQNDGDQDPWKNKYLRYLRSIGHSPIIHQEICMDCSTPVYISNKINMKLFVTVSLCP